MPATPASLWGDRVARSGALLLLTLTVFLSAPILSEPWRAVLGEHVAELLFLAVLIAGLASRARAAPGTAEGRFWSLLALGFACWVLSDVLNLVRDAIGSPDVQRLLVNAPFLLFFAALALALEVHPHVRADEAAGRLRALDRWGAAVFLFGLLMYFLVVPSLQHPFWDSSLALFTALDVYVVARLAGLRHATSDAEWRATYAWLLAGAVIWGLGDVALMLMNEGIVTDPGYGSLFDAVMPAAMAVTLVATRAGAYQTGEAPRFHASREPLGMGPVVGYAVMMPFLHLLLYRFSLADPSVKPEREVLVFGITLILGAVALAYHRRLRTVNRRLAWDEAISRRTLTRLALNDGLTGLPNREMFHDRLALAIADAQRYDRKCAVYFLDLDRFKVINDSLGHEAGDEVLVSAARRLRASVRAVDTVARFGGDEFTIISHGIKSGLDAARAAENMLAALGGPAVMEGRRHVLTASIGIAVFPDDGRDASTLLRRADMAMYQAKVQGGNTYRHFTQAMNDAAEERLVIEESLRSSRPEESFAVFYQPIVKTATEEPIGYEALLRWRHPERGFVAPEAFMDVAEQTGLIVPIGRWVLETACTWAVKMGMRSGLQPIVAVNVSTRQLTEPGFVDDAFAIIRRTGLAPARLHLEIRDSTEPEGESVAPVLAALRAGGIHIAADDFGGGFAALSRLRHYPVDTLKIGRTFVQGVAADSVGEAIVRALVDTAKVLDISVVASGVETEAEFTAVRRLGCDAAQGFYVQGPSPPAPA